MLVQRGFEAVVVIDMDEVVRAVKERKFDLVTLDLDWELDDITRPHLEIDSHGKLPPSGHHAYGGRYDTHGYRGDSDRSLC